MKRWEKPSLIVLARGSSAEKVLEYCKDGRDTFGGGAVGSFLNECTQFIGESTDCENCINRSLS